MHVLGYIVLAFIVKVHFAKLSVYHTMQIQTGDELGSKKKCKSVEGYSPPNSRKSDTLKNPHTQIISIYSKYIYREKSMKRRRGVEGERCRRWVKEIASESVLANTKGEIERLRSSIRSFVPITFVQLKYRFSPPSLCAMSCVAVVRGSRRGREFSFLRFPFHIFPLSAASPMGASAPMTLRYIYAFPRVFLSPRTSERDHR